MDAFHHCTCNIRPIVTEFLFIHNAAQLTSSQNAVKYMKEKIAAFVPSTKPTLLSRVTWRLN